MKKLIGETLKIPAGKIESSEPLEKYGIDSIVVVQLTNTLRKEFDHVSSTLFFEYQTIDALVEHFIKTKTEALMKLTGLDRQVQQHTPAESRTQSSQKPDQAAKRTRRFRKLGFSGRKKHRQTLLQAVTLPLSAFLDAILRRKQQKTFGTT